jgi:hypothetical protein
MTISSENRVNHFNGNGTQTVFPFTFKVFDPTDMVVIRTDTTSGVDTPMAIYIDFTVTINADQDTSPGGNVTMTAAPTSTQRLTVTSDIAYLQPIDVTNGGGFYPEVFTEEFDRLTILTQQLKQSVSSTLRFPVTDQNPVTDLPNAMTRSGKLLGFDSSGDPIALSLSGGGTITGVTSFNGRQGNVSLLSSDVTNLIGFTPNGYEVVNVAAVRALSIPGPIAITTSGYYAAGDGGAANYYLDASDTTTADNGGTVLVTTDGRRFKLKHQGIVSVKQFGAKGDWNGSTGTDDAPAFQAAINAMGAVKGGTVYVPPVAKAYRWNQAVTLASFCTIKGSEDLRIPNIYAVTINDYYGGHCIAITWGAGTTSGQALQQSPDSYVHGLVFMYPGQVASLTASAPVAFPPTIGGVEGNSPGGAITNCYFVNSYKAIYFIYGHGELKIKSVWGMILGDFITIGGCYNADQFEDVNASGIFYLLGSPDANFTNNTGLLAWVQRNGRAFVLGHVDAARWTNCFIGNCWIGMAVAQAPALGSESTSAQYAYGDWTGGGMEGVTFPIYVNGTSTSGVSSNGLRFTSVGFAPVGLFSASRSVTCIMLQPTTGFSDSSEGRGHIIFTGCEFWGAGSWQSNVGTLEGHLDCTGGDVDFIGCTFKVQQSYIARAYSGTPVIKMIGCTSLNTTESAGSYHLAANTGSSGKILHKDCEWRGGLRVFNSSSTAVIAESIHPSIPSFAAASSLALPLEGDFFIITGTTGAIDSIPNAWPGRLVTLKFASAGATISGTGNISLVNGGYTAAAGGNITLRYDGTNYVEISRSPISGTGGASPATVAPPAIAASGVVGTSLLYARQDHTHATQAASVVPFTPPSGMTSTNVQAAIAEVYADLGSGGGASPFNGTPTAIQASGAPGSSTLYARGDHQHSAAASNVSCSPPSGYSSTSVQGNLAETAGFIATLNASKAGLSGDPSIDFNAHSWNLLRVKGSGTSGGTAGDNSLTVCGNNAGGSLTGNSNTALGVNALMNASSCSNATALGRNALDGVNSQGWGNITGVGAASQVTGTNQLQLGDSNTTSFAYGTVQNRSDIRDKGDVRDTVLGLDFINALRPVDFKWNYREDYVDRSSFPVMPIEPLKPDFDKLSALADALAKIADERQKEAQASADLEAGAGKNAADALAAKDVALDAANAAAQSMIEAVGKAVTDVDAAVKAAEIAAGISEDEEVAKAAADAASAAAIKAADSSQVATTAKAASKVAADAFLQATADASMRAAEAVGAKEIAQAASASAEVAKIAAAEAAAGVQQAQQDYANAKAKYDAAFAQYLQKCEAWRATNAMDKVTRDGSKMRKRYHHGLIAQEVQAVIASTGIDFGGFQDHARNGTGMDVLSIGYEELIAPLIKAVQQLTARVAELEKK